MIAALYVETGGAYFGLPDVDPWDERRDARGYAGPWRVIAHPPCNKWSPLAYINQARIPGYRVGDDGGCFELALRDVDRWGGVLAETTTRPPDLDWEPAVSDAIVSGFTRQVLLELARGEW